MSAAPPLWAVPGAVSTTLTPQLLLGAHNHDLGDSSGGSGGGTNTTTAGAHAHEGLFINDSASSALRHQPLNTSSGQRHALTGAFTQTDGTHAHTLPAHIHDLGSTSEGEGGHSHTGGSANPPFQAFNFIIKT